MTAPRPGPPRGVAAPGPAGRVAVRELLASRADQIGWTERARDRYGEVFALRLPRQLPGAPPQILYACEPAAVREILTDSERFTKTSPVYEEIAAALGDGLLTSEGSRWRAQRRTLQPLFTRKHVTRYADPFLAAIHDVIDGWRPGGTVDLADEMERVTLGSVSRALFGTNATADVAPIVTATDTLSRITVERGTAPVRTPRWLPTPRNRTYTRVRRDLQARVEAIVVAHDDAVAGDDLVAHLHAAVDPETGRRLSQQEVREQAIVFLLAGYDTTSTALTFALHLLASHPQEQAAVRAELVEVLGGREPTADDVGRLERTRWCLLEAMRLYPPAWITGRAAAEDTTVAGFDAPAGSVVLAAFGALHTNPRVWPDPHRFDPSRFAPEAGRERDHYAYLPFGGGPRSCIGDHFALLEATLALAVTLQRWRLAADPRRVPTRAGITQRAAEPVPAEVAAW